MTKFILLDNFTKSMKMHHNSDETHKEDKDADPLKEKVKLDKRASIGVNLRVTGHCQQGGRKYMEDFFAVAYQQTDDEKDLEYAFFGIFDGHGGAEAAAFAKEHLMESIVKDPRFWMPDDKDVLQSIKDGFNYTHQAMWKIHSRWPKTLSGLPSTAGTTASVAFIRRGKIYIGHVGDSGITLGYQKPGSTEWHARSLTKDHKPESEDELARIEKSGGKVIPKMGVHRVVWNRPRIGHKGPVRRSTPIDEIPFLAVARSLGDLWSYNAGSGEFVVSPKPDVCVIPIDTSSFRCLIFGTDGLYNMLSPLMAVHIVQEAEKKNEEATLNSSNPQWINPSKTLVEKALYRWCITRMRADNTSVITLMLDPPGPPRAQVLRNQRLEKEKELMKEVDVPVPVPASPQVEEDLDVGFSPKPRESTAFDTRASTSARYSYDHAFGVLPPMSTLLPTFQDNPKSENSKEDNNEEEDETENENKPDDIQINEISSSFEGDKHSKHGKSDKKTSKKNIIQRKFNLRSNTKNENRAPFGENVAETSRVLRDRRNTTPQHADNTIQKKKKMAISTEKKKILRHLLFKSKPQAEHQPSTAERSKNHSKSLATKTKTKENTTLPSPKRTCEAPASSRASRRSERTRNESAETSPREMRKSTLEQKLRVPEGLFKAKLRAKLSLTTQAASSKLKLKRKGKQCR